MTTAVARRPRARQPNLVELRKLAELQLRELDEKKREMESLIARLKAAEGHTPARPSPLDQVHDLLAATESLRTDSGNLSATAVAEAYGVSLNELAQWLGRSRQSLTKTPDADSLQNDLSLFERVARLRVALRPERFLKWLRISNAQLDGETPLKLMAKGERQVVADLVGDMLTGAPS